MLLGSPRSTESPMDFEYTSRPAVVPAWASSSSSGLPSTSFSQQSYTRFESAPPEEEETRDVDMKDASPVQKVVVRVARASKRTRARSLPAPEEDSQGEESGSESESRVRKEKREKERREGSEVKTSNHYTLNMAGPVVPRPDVPYVLLGYLQFFFNLSLVLVFLYLLVQFILTVQRDVEHRISEYSMDIVQEIAECAYHHKNNLCAANPVPAMTHQCALWETCMNRDPTKVGRAAVGAELIAEVVNGFVEPISWKTLAFTLSSLSFLTIFVNSLLSLYRARHAPTPHPAPAHHPPPYAIPPPTWAPAWAPAVDTTPRPPLVGRAISS